MNHTQVPPKNQFTIGCDGSGGIVITNGKKKAGGNVASKPLRKISWKNDTGKVCKLKFTRLVSDDGDVGTGDAAWPFEEPKPADNRLTIGAGATEQRTLMKVTPPVPVCVEYEVLDAKGAPLHDPVIIIDPN